MNFHALQHIYMMKRKVWPVTLCWSDVRADPSEILTTNALVDVGIKLYTRPSADTHVRGYISISINSCLKIPHIYLDWWQLFLVCQPSQSQKHPQQGGKCVQNKCSEKERRYVTMVINTIPPCFVLFFQNKYRHLIGSQGLLLHVK